MTGCVTGDGSRLATRSPASSVEAAATANSPPSAFHPRPHAPLRLKAHTTVMLAADQVPQRRDSLRSVESTASNASLSRKPRTSKLRPRSRSVATDTRRSTSISEDAHDLLSGELFASYSALKSRSAGHSPLNSPDFNLPPRPQPPPFLFSTPIQRRPSSAEPFSQPELSHLRGRHQIPGPSKVSTT